jgi:ATP-dependent protease ClpP protease subunit
MTGIILINDAIGAYLDEQGQMKGVQLINVIEQVKKLPEGTKVVNVQISSPGGLVSEGDAIYEYLNSLKKQYQVNTEQVGLVASIATKIFLVGQIRTADSKFDFVIHNPWTDPGAGDAAYMADTYEKLLAEEDKLRKFYSKELNITEEGLAPLMDQETNLTGEQRVSLGFATTLKSAPVLALYTKEKKGMNLKEKIKALSDKVLGKAEVKALDLHLADGTVLVSDAADASTLVGSNAMKDGNPAPDGDYPAADGSVVTVAGGKITVVMPPAQDKTTEARFAALEESVGKIADAVIALSTNVSASIAAKVTEVETKAKKELDAQINALKTEIGTTHEPKKAARVYAEKGTPEGNKGIRARALEVEERIKKTGK